MITTGVSGSARALTSAILLAIIVAVPGKPAEVSADPIAYWKGPLGIIEVYKGSELAKLVINLPGKTYTVEAPEDYYGGTTLAADTPWEIYWPHPHAADFTDVSMTIMDAEVVVEQIVDADTIWDRIADELADSSILDLYGTPTLRAVYTHPDPLYTGDVFDTTRYSDTLDMEPPSVYTVQYECMIAKYLHMPYQYLTLRAAIFKGDCEVDSVAVDYPNSLVDINEIGDSIIVKVANYDSVPSQDLFIRIYGYPAGVDRDGEPAPRMLGLSQNSPNPFTSATEIRYELLDRTRVTLDIYSLTGQKVRNLVDGIRNAGHALARWDGRNQAGLKMPSGIYYYRLRSGRESLTRRMVLLR